MEIGAAVALKPDEPLITERPRSGIDVIGVA